MGKLMMKNAEIMLKSGVFSPWGRDCGFIWAWSRGYRADGWAAMLQVRTRRNALLPERAAQGVKCFASIWNWWTQTSESWGQLTKSQRAAPNLHRHLHNFFCCYFVITFFVVNLFCFVLFFNQQWDTNLLWILFLSLKFLWMCLVC